MIRDRRFLVGLLISLVGMLVLLFHLYWYGDYQLLDKLPGLKGGEKGPGAGGPGHEGHPLPPPDSFDKFSSDIVSIDKTNKIVIFPQSYNQTDLVDEYIQFHDGLPEDKPVVVRYNQESLDKVVFEQEYSPFLMNVFGSDKNIDEDMDKCPEINNRVPIGVSLPYSMEVPLEPLLLNFIKQQPEYYLEITLFFNEDNHLEKLIDEKQTKKHWFRLAGSSVYLKEYGVHFMTSRLLFSPSGVRDKPAFSLLVAHIYDKNWKEIPNVELIVPSNNPDLHQENPNYYKSINYPSVLPIPFFHNSEVTHDRFYGPEDPRIVLVKNPHGHEEPLIVFNQEHRKLEEYTLEGELDLTLKLKRYRSMFIGWPWQFQRGKHIVNVVSPKPEWDSRLYTRIIELKRDNIDRKGAEKNWTPMLSFQDQREFHHDKFIYLVYRWLDLEILKCPLSDIDNPLLSNCEYQYRMSTDAGSVGDFRGGTEMININSLLRDQAHKSPSTKDLLKQIPHDREVWIGFARAHINCVCAKSMYRPNLAIITKTGNDYKISHTSSFLSLNIPMIKWAPDSKGLCDNDGPSVLIPNGISDWVIDDKLNDYLTLTYSVADATVDMVHLKGVLASLFDLGPSSPFVANDISREAGFNNENIDCAIEGSKAFCDVFKSLVDKVEAGENDKEESQPKE